MKLVDTLEKLSNANGVTGREDQVRELMKQYLKPYVDEMREDKLGNLIAVKRGKQDAPTIMLAGSSRVEETAPFNKDNLRVLKAENISCSPCMKNRCKFKSIKCLENITAQQVISAVDELLPEV